MHGPVTAPPFEAGMLASPPAKEGSQEAAPLRHGVPRWWSFLEDKVLLNLATALMMAAMGFMFYEASSRSLLSESHWWTEELVRFLVVWSVLLSIGVASRRGHYIRMDLLVMALPAAVRRALAWLNALVGLGFSLVLVLSGLYQVGHLHAVGMFTESNLDLPLWQVRLVMPIGGFLYALYFVGSMIALWRGIDPNEPHSP